MADVQILRTESASGNLDFVVPGSQEIIVKAIKASYDGGGAAGSFIPAVQVISPAGEDAGTYTAVSELAAGDSADVSFGPFLVGLGDAIRFDVDNRGGTLRVTTTGQDGVTGDGMRFVTEGGGGYDVVSSGSLTLVSQSGALTVWNQDAASSLQLQSDGPVSVVSGPGTILGIVGGVDGDIDMTTSGTGTQRYQSADGFIWVSTHTGVSENVYVFHLSAGDNFIIRDSANNPILYITEAGPTYHIKAGGAWVADL
jgi:hypothetical protein